MPFAWVQDAKLVLNDDLMKRGAQKRAARLADPDAAEDADQDSEEEEA